MHTVGLHAAGLSQTQQKNFSSVPHRRPGVAANRYHPQTTNPGAAEENYSSCFDHF